MRVLMGLVLVGGLWGCGDKDGDSGVEELTFTEINTVFLQSCGFSGCHGGGEGGLTLDGEGDFDALVGVASTGAEGETLIVSGDADGSYLVKKLEGASGITGDPMPPSDSLDAATIASIRDWIDRGAPND